MEQFMASRALHVAVAKEADRRPPIPADERNLLAGAKVYANNCAVCHGVLGETDRSPIAAGMFPSPPPLLPPSRGVTDDRAGETHWKVHNGIRLTGMPGFEGALTEEEQWQVSLLLQQAGQLPPAVQEALK